MTRNYEGKACLKERVLKFTRWYGHDHERSEDAVVRYWRRPDVPGDTPCGQCGEIMDLHGWLDTGGDGQRVCPGDYVVTNGVQTVPVKAAVFERLFAVVE